MGQCPWVVRAPVTESPSSLYQCLCRSHPQAPPILHQAASQVGSSTMPAAQGPLHSGNEWAQAEINHQQHFLVGAASYCNCVRSKALALEQRMISRMLTVPRHGNSHMSRVQLYTRCCCACNAGPALPGHGLLTPVAQQQQALPGPLTAQQDTATVSRANAEAAAPSTSVRGASTAAGTGVYTQPASTAAYAQPASTAVCMHAAASAQAAELADEETTVCLRDQLISSRCTEQRCAVPSDATAAAVRLSKPFPRHLCSFTGQCWPCACLLQQPWTQTYKLFLAERDEPAAACRLTSAGNGP